MRITERQVYTSLSVDETEALGASFAEEMVKRFGKRPFFVRLEGSLGAGKTAFTRGAASVLSPGSRVKSPSYTIVNEYRLGDIPLFHFDLYRLGEDADLSDIGFSEYVDGGRCIVEWSEYLKDAPEGAVTVKITADGDGRRTIEIIYP